MRERTRCSRPGVEAPRRWRTREPVSRAGVSRTCTGCASRRLAMRTTGCAAPTARADAKHARGDSRDEEHNPGKAVASLTRTGVLDHPGLGFKIRCSRGRGLNNHRNVLA